MEYSNEVKIYRRRKPQETSLWKLLDHYFLEFEGRYDDLFQQQYGFFRPVISHVVRKYLECGDLREGFARIKCPDCHHEFILVFSCRGRWFCPSCQNKKVVQFGHHLKETVLYPVPHRQYVFSVPKILRIISFIYKKTVIKKILTHLNIFKEKKNQRAPPRTTPECTEAPEIVSYDDGWPGYDEPVFDF